jgi:hypothetical protein
MGQAPCFASIKQEKVTKKRKKCEKILLPISPWRMMYVPGLPFRKFRGSHGEKSKHHRPAKRTKKVDSEK